MGTTVSGPIDAPSPGGLQVLRGLIDQQIAEGSMTGETVTAENNILDNPQGFVDELRSADSIHFNGAYFNPEENLITAAEHNYLQSEASADIQAKTFYYVEF